MWHVHGQVLLVSMEAVAERLERGSCGWRGLRPEGAAVRIKGLGRQTFGVALTWLPTCLLLTKLIHLCFVLGVLLQKAKNMFCQSWGTQVLLIHSSGSPSLGEGVPACGTGIETK